MPEFEHQGKIYHLGAKHRPVDPREFAYRLQIPSSVDLDSESSIVNYISRVEDQGQMGSCVANAVTSGVEALATILGLTVVQLDRLWLYARTRQKEGTFPQDAGSYPANACDIAMLGLPPESAEKLGYVADPQYNPGPDVDAKATYKYLASHQPIFVSGTGGFYGGIAAALDAKKPVIVAGSWYPEYFNPTNGVLPITHSVNSVGGHCWYAYARFRHPIFGRLAVCRNSWGTGWTDASVRSVYASASPGDFFVPEQLFLDGTIWEARALTGIVVPKPTVITKKLYVNIWTPAPAPDNWHIDTVPLGPVPDAGAWYQYVEKKDGTPEKAHSFERVEP